MKSTEELINNLKLIVDDKFILSDIEDRYVYSFEKIFMKQVYPLPDIIVKASSSNQIEKLTNFAKQENFLLLKRGDYLSDLPTNSPKAIILLDNVEIPVLEKDTNKIDMSMDIAEKIREIHRTGHGTYRNLALAVQTLMSTRISNKCQQCTTCSDYCTVTPSFDGIETWSARGRALLIKGVMKGELQLSPKIVDILYTCSKCGRCFGECYQDVNLHEAIVKMRHHIAENNMVPQVFHSAAKNISDHGDPSGISADRRINWMKNVERYKLPEVADNLLFLGCMVANRTPKTAKSIYNILNQTQTDFTMLGEKEGCCGYVLISSGLWDEARQVANEIIDKVEKIKAETLITPCAGCYYTFKKIFPETLEVSMPCEIKHSTQFIEKMIKNNELQFKSTKQKITYHDPCSLGRHSKVFDSPRNILKAIPDLQLIEMSLNKSQSRCCGGGGGLWSFKHKISMNSTYTRLKNDYLPLNISKMTTACPQCQMNFRFSAKKNSIPLEITDIMEIVESAIIV